MTGTVVGVLRGGPSREHEVSLMSGHSVVSNLPRDIYTVRDIYIDKQGVWHERGKPSTPVDILRTVDVVVNALHGEYGEDGEVQRLLERMNIPFTGSDSVSSYFAIHKALAKEKAKEIGLKTPRYYLVEPDADVEMATYHIIRSLRQPVVVKPIRWGSSVGISVVGGYAPVHQAISNVLAHAESVLVEEYVRGIEATVGVIEKFRNEDLYALPSIEIIPPPNDFFSYDAKYGGKSIEICPGRFPPKVHIELADNARKIHQALGLRHYSRSDFIVTPHGVYYLETNSLPGLTRESLFPKSMNAVGVHMPDFLTHIVGLAMQG